MRTTDTFRPDRFGDSAIDRALRADQETPRGDLSPARLQAAKALFLLAAGASFLFSVYLWFLVDREQGLFVGLWVPSILSLGTLLVSGKGGRS